MITPFIDTST